MITEEMTTAAANARAKAEEEKKKYYASSFDECKDFLKEAEKKQQEKIDKAKLAKIKDKLVEDEIIPDDNPEVLSEDPESYKHYLDMNARRTSDTPYIPQDVLTFIYGDNPKRRIYYNTDAPSFATLIQYCNDPIHKAYLQRTDITIEDKMSYMFGEDWDKDDIVYTAEQKAKNIQNFHDDMLIKTNKKVVETIKALERQKKNQEDTINKISTSMVESLPTEGVISTYDPHPSILTADGTHLSTLTTVTTPQYEMVNHPSHYNQYDKEVIDMMVAIWGKQSTALWCKLTAFKYRMRMGTKPENSVEQDLAKEKWYLKKSKELLGD